MLRSLKFLSLVVPSTLLSRGCAGIRDIPIPANFVSLSCTRCRTAETDCGSDTLGSHAGA
jgi:hypothetical protein